MYRIRPRAAKAFVVVTLVAMVTKVFARNYHPHPQNGYPAGMIPECPGVTKNASISPGMLPLLQITAHRVTEKGEVVRKSMPLMMAPNMVAKDKHYDFKNKKTVLYAVGFWDHSWFLHSQAVGTAYSKRGYNVFITQTFAFFTQVYPKAARMARYIGRMYGEFLVKLTEQGLDAEDLELLGLSLGAHVVSFAANHLERVTGKKPSRITGLDPAGPCFRSLPPEDRLDASDAERVDILHTNIDGFGMAERMGHIDFYANGGEYQPFLTVPCLIVCSHVKSLIYWWKAMDTKQFIGVKCDSIEDARFANCFNNTQTNILGLETDFEKPGIYYLPVNISFPFYSGLAGLNVKEDLTVSVMGEVNAADNLVT